MTAIPSLYSSLKPRFRVWMALNPWVLVRVSIRQTYGTIATCPGVPWQCRALHLCNAPLQLRLSYLSLSLSLIPGLGRCHGLDRLQKGPHASTVGRVDIIGKCPCLRVRWAAKKKKMLCHLVVTFAVWTHWRLLSSDKVNIALYCLVIAAVVSVR